jgi:entry exclusion lipoprotein TrbK
MAVVKVKRRRTYHIATGLFLSDCHSARIFRHARFRYTRGIVHSRVRSAMKTCSTLLLAVFTVALAGCNSKVDPQLQADQMTLSDATCAEAEVARIADAAVRTAFAARCARRTTAARGG